MTIQSLVPRTREPKENKSTQAFAEPAVGSARMSKRYRVLFFSPVSYYKGGAERSLMDLIGNPSVEAIVLTPAEGPINEAMRKRQVETCVLHFGGIEHVHRPFRLVDGFSTFATLIRSAKGLIEICDREKIDLVHSNGLKAHVISSVARRLGGKPVILHIRDIPLTKTERLIWGFLRLASDKLVLVSRACWPADRLPEKVCVIYNGMPANTQVPTVRERSTNRGMVVGFIGRLHPSKGLHVLLEWLGYAIRAGLDVRLVIRGSFSTDSPQYEDQISALIRRLALKDNVMFEGFIDDPRRVYDGVDVVCVPSHIPDPLPRAVMEAMSYGVPVIAFPTGGIPEMIENGKSGFFVRNAADFVAAIKRLLDDWSIASSITDQARRKISAQFTLDLLYKKQTALYDSLLS
jgi:glycosyltransferase involved in cell wall biosynthesis